MSETQIEAPRGLEFRFNDGGRAAAGYRGNAGDCTTRSIAIATGQPYQVVYDAINAAAKSERRSKYNRGQHGARTGVRMPTIHRYMQALGWTWVPTMSIGSGCKVHLAPGELPAGRLVVRVTRHMTAVIDGVIEDTHDPSRGGTRCVYGYWHKPEVEQ